MCELLVDVARLRCDEPGSEEAQGPRYEHAAARSGRQEMVGGHPGEGVLRAAGREAANRGNEPEQQVLDDEDPHEHADDGADVVADDRPDADTDPAPERGRHDRAQAELQDRTPPERAVDAAAGEDPEPDRT